MAFKLNAQGAPRTSVLEKYPLANGVTVLPGTALIFSSGKLTPATGANRPGYIAQQAMTGNGSALVSVIRVTPLDEYETTATAAPALGAKVTLHEGGAQVTATTTNGVFSVSNVRAEGSKVIVRGYFD